MSTQIPDWLRRRPLIVFACLAYAFSWLLWLAAERAGALSSLLVWLGGFGPAVAGMVLAARLDGRAGLRDLLAQAFVWKVGPRWYLAAVGLPVLGTVGLILLGQLTGLVSQAAVLTTWLAGLGRNSGMLALVLVLGMVIVAGEEFGWRGFVLPRLQARYNDLSASLAVGVMWGFWHLPDLWPFNPRLEALDLFLFMADILAVSVIYTWLYRNSRKSLLVVCLFHSTYDTLVFYASASLPFLHAAKGYELVVMMLMAGLILVWKGPARFGPQTDRWLTEGGPLSTPSAPGE